MKGVVVVLTLAVFLIAGGYAAECLANAVVLPGFCAWKWATGVNQPRGILVLSNNDVLVVESGSGSISLFYENNGSVQKVNLASASGLNHGIAYRNGFLFASSPSTVYRWAYTVGNRNQLGAATTVLTGIPTGGHNTRTLVFDPNGNLLVQVGSNGNIDRSGVAGIYRFNPASFPSTWSAGTKIASGLRNEVGLKYDTLGRLWGVENGMDNLNRADLGGDIHNQNPGEELNMFVEDGRFYGYPDCFSQYNLSTVSTPRGTQYGLNSSIDAWCQNRANVVPPQYQLRAHTAPLDIVFYNGTRFPNMVGSALVSSHGSWNREPAAGYSIVHVKFNSTNQPYADENFFAFKGPGETGTGWPYRPVGLAFGVCGGDECLLATDDDGGNIIAFAYNATNIATSTSTSGSNILLPHVYMLLIISIFIFIFF